MRGGWVLPATNTIDVAPTIAMLLDVDLPDAEGEPIVGVLAAKPAVHQARSWCKPCAAR